jgi:hypothetical protein
MKTRRNLASPILVTGAPRSGTTWVGRTLAESPGVRYVHEPFNISAPQCRCGIKLSHWFYYAKGEEAPLNRHLNHLLSSPIHPVNIINAFDAVLTRGRRREGLKKLKAIVTSLGTNRPLVKDPLAVFAAEWLAAQFNMKVLVLIRHPAAFVSSYKALNWTHAFSHFLQQPQLLHDCLPSFVNEIEEYSKEDRNLIDQASLLWRLITFQIHCYQRTHPEWIFVRYEDLARDPLTVLGHIFQRVDLPFTDRIRIKIINDSTDQNQSSAHGAYGIHRDSRSNLLMWKQRLTTAEIRQIRHNVRDVSEYFYADDEW